MSTCGSGEALMDGNKNMDADKMWFFSKQEMEDTPSRRNGLSASKELAYRQDAGRFTQDVGRKLKLSQLTINSSIVHMHRFYMQHSFYKYDKYKIATAALFLSCKVEDEPRKAEDVLKVAHYCRYRKGRPALEVNTPEYMKCKEELIANEQLILVTLDFTIRVQHPHPHVLNLCNLVRASSNHTMAAYYLATNSLILTTMCLRFSPSIVACVCINLACKWLSIKFPVSDENKRWFEYAHDKSITMELLEELTNEFFYTMSQSPVNWHFPLKKGNEVKAPVGGCATVNGNTSSSIVWNGVFQSTDSVQRNCTPGIMNLVA